MDKFFRLSVILSSAALALPLAAQSAPSSYFSAAYEHVFDDSARGSDEGSGLSLGYGWLLSQGLGVEISGFFHSFDGNSANPGADWDEYGLKADLMGFFAESQSLSPYVAAGIGYMRSELDSAGLDSTDPTFDVGAGLFKYFSNTSLALRADLRYRFVDTDFAPSFSEPVAKLGFIYAFGGSQGGNKVSDKKGAGAGKDAKDSGPNRSFENVNFAFDKAELTDYAKAILDNTAGTIKTMSQKYPSLKVNVAGHTDWVGTDSYNQALSERRANMVKTYLMDKGVSLKIDTTAYGESKPIATNETEEGRALNRRAEVSTSAE